VVGNSMQNSEKASAQTQSQINSQQHEIQNQQKQIQQLKSEQETQ